MKDVTTVVVTSTITGLFAYAGRTGSWSDAGRRLLAVALELVGALVGALLLLVHAARLRAGARHDRGRRGARAVADTANGVRGNLLTGDAPTGSVERVSSPLTLVDWRDRMAALFDAVRAEPDPAAGHARWRAGRAELFAHHPDSPLRDQPELRERGLSYWPYDPALRFEVALAEPALDAAGPDELGVDTGDDGGTTLRRVGRVDLPGLGSLDVWRLHQYGGGLFVPLRDGTSAVPGDDGASSYGGGRYLVDTAKGAHLGVADGTLTIDLNFAYHPSCRYDPRWRCPLAPPGNRLEVRVEAGEQY